MVEYGLDYTKRKHAGTHIHTYTQTQTQTLLSSVNAQSKQNYTWKTVDTLIA